MCEITTEYGMSSTEYSGEPLQRWVVEVSLKRWPGSPFSDLIRKRLFKLAFFDTALKFARTVPFDLLNQEARIAFRA